MANLYAMAEDLGVITSEILVFWAGGWGKIIFETSGAVSKIGRAACKVLSANQLESLVRLGKAPKGYYGVVYEDGLTIT